MDRAPTDVGRALWPAVEAGMVVPLDAGHRLLTFLDDDSDAGAALECRLRFLHDRVQQASYSLIEESDRPAAHLSVGRRLRGTDGQERNSQLFDVVGHYNRALALLVDDAERADVAALNLRAGRRARVSGAYHAAERLLNAGLRLVSTDRELEADLRLERAISVAQLGRTADASDDFSRVLNDKEVPRERALIRMEWILGLLYAGDHAGVLKQGMAALRALGLEPPSDPKARIAVGLQLMEVATAGLSTSSIGRLVELPRMDDEDSVLIARALNYISPSAFIMNDVSQWFLWVAFSSLKLFRDQGNAVESCHGYSLVAMTLSAMGDNDRGYAFHKLAVELATRLGDVSQLSRTTTCMGFHQAWREPLSAVAETAHRAWRHSLDAGDWFHAQFAAANVLRANVHGGAPLTELETTASNFLDFLSSRANEMAPLYDACLRFVIAMRGEGPTPGDLSRADDLPPWAETIDGIETEAVRVWSQTIQVLAYVMAGRDREALESARAIWPRYVVNRQFGDGGELHFLHALAAARTGALEEARVQLEELAPWTTQNPSAYGPKAALVRAALAEAEGQNDVAIDGYLGAWNGARELGLLHVETLAAYAAGELQE